MASFAERFNEALLKRNVSPAEIARRLNVADGTISNYKKGKYEPKQRRTEEIARILRVSISWLMGADVPMNQDVVIPEAIPVSSMIPIYGCIPAGVPAFAEQYILDYMPSTVKNPEEYFCLKVNGKSMIGAGITNGSTVLVHKQNCADNGQIIACRINGDEATLKRFKQQGDTVILLPENPEFEPIICPCSAFDCGDAEILGVVKQVIIDM